MHIFFRELIGLFVWLVANAVYANDVRRGIHGFRRFLAFWMGMPATFFVKILVKEGSQPVVEPPPDDDDALLKEIRRDRALRPPADTDPPDA